MSYAELPTEDMQQTAMVSLHHLAARTAAMMTDPDAVRLERILEEVFSRLKEADLKRSGNWTDRERAKRSSLADKEIDFPS